MIETDNKDKVIDNDTNTMTGGLYHESEVKEALPTNTPIPPFKKVTNTKIPTINENAQGNAD